MLCLKAQECRAGPESTGALCSGLCALAWLTQVVFLRAGARCRAGRHLASGFCQAASKSADAESDLALNKAQLDTKEGPWSFCFDVISAVSCSPFTGDFDSTDG